MATTTGDLAAVVLSPITTLTQAQVRGAACVWCAVALNNSTAIDLGVRETDAHGTVGRWFPRGCRPCAMRRVYPAQLDHTAICEQCTDDPGLCAPGTWFRLVMRQVRR
ncbi:hypothetical protein [Streptomyces longhuiensis]|uniref:hypothetical protein n=1 Tax=Streptomyces longhuiensis TaxID=2880933 RepID=UPI001D0B7A6B|nr:hypothetical protein [Streptomyces longhuiensis]UDM05428.1 hypothetical protein LGI35_45020 [Streptomyces longhuiensis]